MSVWLLRIRWTGTGSYKVAMYVIIDTQVYGLTRGYTLATSRSNVCVADCASRKRPTSRIIVGFIRVKNRLNVVHVECSSLSRLT